MDGIHHRAMLCGDWEQVKSRERLGEELVNPRKIAYSME